MEKIIKNRAKDKVKKVKKAIKKKDIVKKKVVNKNTTEKKITKMNLFTYYIIN